MNQIGLATLIASKAARWVIAARGRRLIDFGLRRSQGADAGLVAARSSYLAGFVGTSNVLAGRRYGIPLYGTMAHSYIMAHEREREAFEHFVELFPQLSTLLVDTYDTVRGVENAAVVALDLHDKGGKLQAVRLDSATSRTLALGAPYPRSERPQRGRDLRQRQSRRISNQRPASRRRADRRVRRRHRDGHGRRFALARSGYKLAEFHGVAAPENLNEQDHPCPAASNGSEPSIRTAAFMPMRSASLMKASLPSRASSSRHPA